MNNNEAIRINTTPSNTLNNSVPPNVNIPSNNYINNQNLQQNLHQNQQYQDHPSNQVHNTPQVQNTHQLDTNFKNIFTNYNYILIIIVALAWNEVAKYYIGRAIKFYNGSHLYYIYYAVALTLVIYISSKFLQKI